MSNQTSNNEKDRSIHEALVKHLGDPSSCRCGNTCGCLPLKRALSNLGREVFLEKAIAGKLPIEVQELYDKKFLAMAKKPNP